MTYDDRVSQHWPEFAQAGKGDLLIKDVLRHEAGLTGLEETVQWGDVSRGAIKENKIGEVLRECMRSQQ